MSDLQARSPAGLVPAVVARCVGDAAAAEFVGFWLLYHELPDVDLALAAPEAAPVPREPAVLYALVGSLVEACRRDHAPLPAFVTYAARLPDELALRDALAVQPGLASLPGVQQWIAAARGKGLFPAA